MEMDSAQEKKFCVIQFAKTNSVTGVQRGVLDTTERPHHQKTDFETIFQDCGLGEPDFGSSERKEIFVFPKSPDRFGGPPSLLFDGEQDFFTWGKAAFRLRLTSRFSLEPRLRGVEPYLPPPLVYLHAVYRNNFTFICC